MAAAIALGGISVAVSAAPAEAVGASPGMAFDDETWDPSDSVDVSTADDQVNDADAQAALDEATAAGSSGTNSGTGVSTVCPNSAPLDADVSPLIVTLPTTGCVSTYPMTASLGISWVQQQAGNYCGPATAYMILKYRGLTTTKDGSGTSLSQAHLAGASYLKTNANGATTWASHTMEATLDKWVGANQYKTVAGSTLTATSLKGAFRTNVNNGQALAADTVETNTIGHYNSHHSGTIGHWITGYGYSGGGSTISFADPAAGLSGYTASSHYFSYATSGFVKFLGNGVVY